MAVAEEVYRATYGFPAEERFGLCSSMRRAAVSIPSNLAEGCGRRTNGEFVRFVNIAHGSLLELETQLFLAERLGFLSRKEARTLLNEAGEIGRMLNGLRISLSNTQGSTDSHLDGSSKER
jgi:four helix bundle protein